MEKMTIPFSKIVEVKDRYDINQNVKRTSDYINVPHKIGSWWSEGT